MKNNKNLIKYVITTVIVLTIAALMILLYFNTRDKEVKGSKEVTIEIIIPDEKTKEYILYTDTGFLRQALEEEDLINGREDIVGLYITEVDGRLVDESKHEWWSITKNGEEVFTGVDEIVIDDGDHYEFTLSVW